MKPPPTRMRQIHQMHCPQQSARCSASPGDCHGSPKWLPGHSAEDMWRSSPSQLPRHTPRVATLHSRVGPIYARPSCRMAECEWSYEGPEYAVRCDSCLQHSGSRRQPTWISSWQHGELEWLGMQRASNHEANGHGGHGDHDAWDAAAGAQA